MPPLFWQFDKFAAGNAFPISGFVAFGTGVLGVLWWLGGWVFGWLAFGTGEGLLWYGMKRPAAATAAGSEKCPSSREAVTNHFRR